ncbi:helix-turn-helix domain-containing protein [Streptomyces sp. NPDC094143]|uniref:helix-turn-helix domain-containing protein n=1 Tax=unclassified Streptomyces TaxID=2593676 RepID=UPI00331C1DFF
MEKPQPVAAASETLGQVLAAIKDELGLTETEIANRIGSHVSTVNNWAHGKAFPREPALLKLAEAFPRYRARLFAATGKRSPAPLSDDRREAVLKVFDRLTEEQQQMLLIQANAVAEANDRQG